MQPSIVSNHLLSAKHQNSLKKPIDILKYYFWKKKIDIYDRF